jgi:pimeloyl-ACP methyl ester carboxylesterase
VAVGSVRADVNAGTTVGTVRVPGANLHYRRRGSGPLLLVIQGGAGDAEASEELVDHLVEHYEVLTYDRRGLSRSTLDDPSDAPSGLATHSEDVHHLLAALTDEPVYVLGTSIGAMIGLDVTARYPAQVRALIAHEPPITQLLPEAERERAARAQEDIEETHRREGVVAAAVKFVQFAGIAMVDREPEVQLRAPSSRQAVNLKFFLTHDAGAVRLHRLDMAALRSGPVIVPAAGSTNREHWVNRCSVALGAALEAEVAEFPGGHAGFMTHPKGFAARLRAVLGSLGS